MSLLGTILKNRHAGESAMAWNMPNLAADKVFEIFSADFAHEEPLDVVHASKRIGGGDISPALAWAGIPAGTAQLLVVVEDPDAPTAVPFVHCVALVDPTVAELPSGALASDTSVPGVRILRSGWGRGYAGPAPIAGHGPHRYVFQIFALTDPLTLIGGKSPEKAKPRAVLAAARAHARGRIDGFYERL
ncbi:YbhB/YbcL family Raf kinase inhibitor-like protein [Nocardia sp. SYP-A9097]|uniref:YbhB/YbcL family Raf kinase inhibitor-like protein n=1 Tax=Nocardia sp. SYP-A9097 TaxID=2663237 RepID=UPI00129A957C|nr:YbhB/YbcL family Raf kinase inhibitor-like protein [Nocardia sp. SYP-A9097]MRH90493.1 YbhB/YbcL family Raf kinase inhibitor-like protein [Nocardia sp. SYP-A9097]